MCCIPGYPQVWARVTEVLDWIDGIIKEGGQDENGTSGAGSYPPLAIRMLVMFHLALLCIKKGIHIW